MSLNGEKHDMTPEERALQLIKELSLEEKIGTNQLRIPI